MSKKLVSVSTLQKGSYVMMGEQASRVTDIQVSRPGKHGHAKIRMSAVGLIDNKKRVEVMPGHDNIEVPIIDKKTAQVLSVHGDSANVMDVETYETFDLEIPEELKEKCVDGVNVLFWQILDKKVMKQVKTD
jgi:translation initiation factor 5A